VISVQSENHQMIVPKKDTIYWDIIHCMILNPRNDYTCREIHSYITGDVFGQYSEKNILAGTLAGRISEMKKLGYLQNTGTRKCEVSKRRVNCFDISNEQIKDIVEEHYERVKKKEAEETERKKMLDKWFE